MKFLEQNEFNRDIIVNFKLQRFHSLLSSEMIFFLKLNKRIRKISQSAFDIKWKTGQYEDIMILNKDGLNYKEHFFR